MLRLNAKNLQELEIEISEKSIQVSVEIIKNVCKALEEGADKVNIAILTNLDMDLSIHKDGYLEALITNLERCSAAEEYELCQNASNWIDILKKNND